MKKSWVIGVIVVLVIITIGFFVMKAPSYFVKNQANDALNNAQNKINSIQTEVISIKNFAFNPPIVNIAIGEKVTWKNEDAVTHDITIDSGLFDKDVLAGESFTYIFNETRIYDYHCDIHPSMKGRVVVN